MRSKLAMLLALLSLMLARAEILMQWTRRLDTCDPDDNAITEGATKMTFAYSDKVPDSDTSLQKHDVRYARSAL